MPIGTSLGAHFEDDFDHQAGREYTPPEIKPKSEADSNVKTPNEAQQDKQLNDIEMQELGGIPIRMRIFPQKEPETVYPEPDYLNPPEREPTVEVPRPPAQVLFKTKTGVTITDHDIDDAISVGMSAGPGTLNVKNYINHFLKPPVADVPKTAVPELDPTEKAIKAIMEALEGPGAYDAKYGSKGVPWSPETSPTYQKMLEKNPELKEGEAFLKQPKTDSFEQVPFGYSDGEWAQMSPYQKKQVLDNSKGITAEEFFGPANKGMPEGWSVKEDDGLGLNRELFPEKPKDNPPGPGFTGHYMSPKEAYAHHSDLKSEGFDDAAENFWNEYASKASMKQWKEFGSMGNKYKIAIKDAENKNFKIEGGKWIEDDEIIKSALTDAKDAKLSTFDKMVNALDQIQGKLLNTYVHERAEFHYNKLKETIPELAKEAGYDTPAFRGIKNRDEIKTIHNYDKTNHMYSSDSPLLADMYAEYLSKHPGWNVKQGIFNEGATVAPLVINTKNYHVYDAKGVDWQQANGKAIAEAVRDGKPGVIVKNVWDEPNSTRSLGKTATVYITFPSGAGTVKSRFAKKFDANSKDMLHMVPVLAVGGAAGYVSKQVSNDE